MMLDDKLALVALFGDISQASRRRLFLYEEVRDAADRIERELGTINGRQRTLIKSTPRRRRKTYPAFR